METSNLGEWQLCPKCGGQGNISTSGTSSATTTVCDVCYGAKVLARPVLPIININPAEEVGDVEKIKEVMSKQPMTFVNDPNEIQVIEKFSDKLLKIVMESMKEEVEFLFGLTHYEWMYRATGDEKYLVEKEEFLRKHGR